MRYSTAPLERIGNRNGQTIHTVTTRATLPQRADNPRNWEDSGVRRVSPKGTDDVSFVDTLQQHGAFEMLTEILEALFIVLPFISIPFLLVWKR